MAAMSKAITINILLQVGKSEVGSMTICPIVPYQTRTMLFFVFCAFFAQILIADELASAGVSQIFGHQESRGRFSTTLANLPLILCFRGHMSNF